ncbi:esterase [Rhodococcus sp. PAMC28707]|uniref:alpha/beta hydrolase n=1 Tax=unclassified Rhodococcus (in: high G+C Gram-positive bacteria) TaxID=192944 RepID=UPI00109D8B7C|nr:MULTISPECIES: alpha/beta hydrolase-fold protein [unclassified Rhodococcus (in: high G+C Gram-positive bacteria)]QCB51203.1 esterase [Rhodococcus sp. PAMC28705]QCB60629.1 esterase [Rhodococcus sp. PAMC28707]
MHSIVSLSLISGTTPILVSILGLLGALWLLVSRRRRYLLLAVPIALVVASVFGLSLYYVVEKVWRPFPDPIEVEIYVWIAVGASALLLMVPRTMVASGFLGRALSILAALLVVLVASVQVNLVFSAYPTVGTVFGVDSADRIRLADLPGPESGVVTGDPLDKYWHPPADMPSAGKVTSVSIPATASGFSAREAQVYLPPAYFVDPRPLLPVLVLLAGQPGAPEDWLNGGKLIETMDAFAHDHDGLAPVVVVADATGSALANPLCVDSPLGNVATYLSKDVPSWFTSALQIDPNPRSRTIGGLSYGGTCALQMATNFPDVYPTFLDLSGQLEPTLGDRNRTVNEVFGGNEAAFVAVNPMDLLKTRQFPDSGGAFVVGADDNDYKPGQKAVYEAAQAAGMDVRYAEVPGGHSFAVWSEGLKEQLPWLMQRVGLIS